MVLHTYRLSYNPSLGLTKLLAEFSVPSYQHIFIIAVFILK